MSSGEHQKCLNVKSDFAFRMPAFQMNGETMNLVSNILHYYSKNDLAAPAPSVCCSDPSAVKHHKTKTQNYCMDTSLQSHPTRTPSHHPLHMRWSMKNNYCTVILFSSSQFGRIITKTWSTAEQKLSGWWDEGLTYFCRVEYLNIEGFIRRCEENPFQTNVK